MIDAPTSAQALSSLYGALGAVAGNLAIYVSIRPRVRRLERRFAAIVRLLLGKGLTEQQRALVESLLSDDSSPE